MKVFISYSSKDSEFATRLANDLKKMGFDIWLDRWEIKVGDDIFDKIQFGVRESDYVLLVLSSNSISSGWVDKEWKMAYWSEITSRQVKLLPVMLEACDMPEFLKFKKYADFRKGYETAFKELLRPMKSKDFSSIKNVKGRENITEPSRFQFFKKIFDFAHSVDGLYLTSKAAREFALKWYEKWSIEDFECFKDVFIFAYSVDGLYLTSKAARQFAFQWLENHYDKNFRFFKDVFIFAHSVDGLYLTSKAAREFALKWLETHKPPSMPERPT